MLPVYMQIFSSGLVFNQGKRVGVYFPFYRDVRLSVELTVFVQGIYKCKNCHRAMTAVLLEGEKCYLNLTSCETVT